MKLLKQKQKRRKKVVFGIFFIIVLLFTTYSYAIASTTFSISDMKYKNTKIADLQTNIAELELEYLSILNNVSIEDASKYGLMEIENIAYVSLEKDTFVAYNF